MEGWYAWLVGHVCGWRRGGRRVDILKFPCCCTTVVAEGVRQDGVGLGHDIAYHGWGLGGVCRLCCPLQ